MDAGLHGGSKDRWQQEEREEQEKELHVHVNYEEQ